MDPAWQPPVKEINGVNLANYFPHQRSHNSIVFIHKKYLDDNKPNEVKKEKVKPKKDKKVKYDKSQQFSSDKNTEVSDNNRTYKISNNNDSVLDHTIKFAKTLVPLVIPPSEDKMPVFYTIKSTKKHRKKERKPHETSFERHEPIYERKEPKKVIETYRKVRKENFSVRESVSHSSTNTLDDLNINQSLCCTFSEVSEKKYHKKEKPHVNKKHDKKNFIVSESFEALATETPGDSKIKIHLMNEKDKNFLSDSIKTPILNALRECISELSNCNANSDMTTVQKILKCNTSKLDTILERISCIERKLDIRENDKKYDAQTIEKKLLPRIQMSKSKSSALEELEEDITETKEDSRYSSEEELHQEMLDRRSKSAVIELVSEDRSEKKASSLGGGELGALKESTVGIKPDRPNRIPTRFCWTDAARK
uniref:Uncharacterized protein n=1 Tax=Heliothis virescens TaxID=7102 RepID=A0A2A4JCS3_HELVI